MHRAPQRAPRLPPADPPAGGGHRAPGGYRCAAGCRAGATSRARSGRAAPLRVSRRGFADGPRERAVRPPRARRRPARATSPTRSARRRAARSPRRPRSRCRRTAPCSRAGRSRRSTAADHGRSGPVPARAARRRSSCAALRLFRARRRLPAPARRTPPALRTGTCVIPERCASYDFVYVQIDIPEGMTIREWQRERAVEPAASQDADRSIRGRVRWSRWLAAVLAATLTAGQRAPVDQVLERRTGG